jgi:hypothetical protein
VRLEVCVDFAAGKCESATIGVCGRKCVVWVGPIWRCVGGSWKDVDTWTLVATVIDKPR